MNKNFLIFKIIFLLAIVLPFSVKAFDIYLDSTSKNLQLGEPAIVKLMLDTEGKEINAIEGKIKIPKDLNGIKLDTGGSIFSLWPETPEIGEAGMIYFTGGISGGVYGKDLRVFNMSFIPQTKGAYVFEVQELNLYLSDGNGSKVSSEPKNISFEVVEMDDLLFDETIDKEGPVNLVIELGKDENLYDGQYFITFYAIDSGSGINRYEIREGNSKFIDYNSNTYVIKDQTLNTNIWVKAVDNEGNETIKSFKFNNEKNNTWKFILFGGVGFLLIIIFVIKFKKLFYKNEN